MSWREAWRNSELAFPELAFQAIYGYRRGNPLPITHPEKLSHRARSRVLQSKVLISVVVAFVALSTALALSPRFEGLVAPTLPGGLYVGAVITVILVLELAFLWWTGLQVLPTYLTSGVLPVFQTLPIDDRTVDQLAFVLLFRLFDMPALTGLVLTPFAVGLGLHSVLAGLAAIPGTISVLVFALALSLTTGRFFVRHVQGSQGGRGQTVLRWAYLVLWAVPAFAMYAFLTFGLQFFSALTSLSFHGPSVALSGVIAIYPFPMGMLPALGAEGGSASAFPPGVTSVWIGILAAVYFGASLAVGGWLVSATGRLVRECAGTSDIVPALHPRIVSRSPALAILWKDFRTASRTPAFAFLLLLPILDALAVGLLTFVAAPQAAGVFNLGVAAVATAALLATFFGPAFFAIEVMGFSYTQTLPLTQRSMVAGKVLLMVLLYLVAAGTILALTSTRIFAPGIFGLFIAAELPAVVASATFELGLLFRQAWRAGVPIVNMYSAAWRVTAVAIPGLILAALPLVAFEAFRPLGELFAVGLMALVGLTELAGATSLLWGLGTREAR
ncbi:MAG: hypothetical protein WCA77_05705 [Thermoplasmata archaeon]